MAKLPFRYRKFTYRGKVTKWWADKMRPLQEMEAAGTWPVSSPQPPDAKEALRRLRERRHGS